jgi:hypothetical protein
MELIILREVSQAQKTKNLISPSSADFRSRGKCSNVVALGSHSKGRAHMGGMGIGRKTKT